MCGNFIAAYSILSWRFIILSLRRKPVPIWRATMALNTASETADARDLLDMYKKTRMQGFGAEVKRRIMIGTYALSAGYYDAYYKKASQVRALMKRDFEEAFKNCDVILTPTTPTAAFKIGEKTDDPLQMYLSDIFTISANLAGIPGISVPCGFTSGGLPIGVQFLASHFEEGKLIQIASAYEKNAKIEKRRPAL